MNAEKSLGELSEDNNIIWRIEGPFDSTYSLALLNREIARALDNIGVDVLLYSTEGPGDFEPSAEFLHDNPDLASFNNKVNQVKDNEVSVMSRNLYPPRVADMKCKYNLLHSYAWEEMAFPFEWVQNFNNHLDGLTCLSQHVMKVMIDNGVFIPMAVSGCGVDHWERTLACTTSILDNYKTRKFRFLHVSSFFPRKGPDALLDAFGRAFTNRDDVCLVIKTFPNPHNNVHSQLALARERYPDYPDVIIIEDDLTDSDLKTLYQRCHVLVAPSCAEGFGLPLAEAMLSGIPVITTAWSGQLDFCNEQNSWLVDYYFEQADTHFKLLPSAWAVADVDALSNAMLLAAQSSSEERHAMALKGRSLLLKDFTWNHVAKRLVSFYKKLKKTNNIESAKVAWISTWNTKCGIATYSDHLMKGFKNEPVILAAKTNDIISRDPNNVYRCWSVGDDDNLVELSNVIDANNVDVIVIQFNFGFFHHDNLYKFINTQKNAGRVIVIDMHATIDPPHAPNKKLSNYASGLVLADRLLVHSCTDMNRLKSLGIINNLALFPHGILDVNIEQQTVLSEQPTIETPTIATYGFCLPHKGLEQVLESISLLKEQGMLVNLRMINAEYPIDFSCDLVNKIRDRITELGLDEQVMFESRFLSDDESLALLNGSDLVLFVYSPTSESASGAVRYGFACGKPTMVTDIPIFDEFGDSVWKVADNNPLTLSNGIRQALDDIRKKSDCFVEKQSLADSWRNQHSYSRLSIRLQGMLQGLFVQKYFS